MGYEESIKCALDAGANGRVKKLAAEADAEIERLREALGAMLASHRTSGMSNGSIRAAEAQARQALKGKNHD